MVNAAQQIRADGRLLNTLTGLGGEADKSNYLIPKSTTRFAQPWLDDLAQEWPLSEICRALPEAATSKWCELTFSQGDDDQQEVVEAFSGYRNRVGAIEKADLDRDDDELSSDAAVFGEALFLANCYHGAAIVMSIDDGRPPWEPVDLKNIKSIRSIEPMDSFQVFPDLTTTWNPLKATHYQIFFSGLGAEAFASSLSEGVARGAAGAYLKVHKSRVIRLPGQRLTPSARRMNRGWDGSMIEKCWESYSRWESAQSEVQALIADYSLFVYKMAGFAEMVTEEGAEADLSKRIATFRMMANMAGGLILDKEDEDVQFVTRQFGNLDTLVAGFRDSLIGVSGLPHTILFGESPSGLGATGESEQRTWAGQVSTYQATLKPRIKRLYRLIWLAKDGPTKGVEPEGWDINFPSIYEPSLEEELAARSSQAELDGSYKEMGVITESEVRKSRFGNPGAAFSFGYLLDDKEWEESREAAKQAQPGPLPERSGQPEDEKNPPAGEEAAADEEKEAIAAEERKDRGSGRFIRANAPYARLLNARR